MSITITNIIINGPFWKAAGQVVRMEDGATPYPALRKIFIDHPTEVPAPSAPIPVEGTVAALCRLSSVAIALPGTAGSFNFSPPAGHESLLLLRSQGKEGTTPTFRCLNGYITLIGNANELTPLHQKLALQAPDPGPRAGKAELPGSLSAHSSGLSIFGSINLPWETERLNASFLLAEEIREGEEAAYRLTVEAERLTPAEHAAWVASWQRLQKMIDPTHPLNAPPQPGPRWASLELAGLDDVPDIYWKAPDGTQKLFFNKGAARLYLTDQSVYDEKDGAPATIARLLPGNMRIEEEAGNMRLLFGEKQEAANVRELIRYQAGGDGWAEAYTFSNLSLAYDPVQTARRLRQDQGMPSPELNTAPSEKIEPPVIWGYMPLEDGWAQLPFLNISEQLYLDNELANEEVLSKGIQRLNFQGGVTYGNEDAIRESGGNPAEHPWEISLIDCAGFFGAWAINQGQGLLSTAELELYEPEVAANGFLWLSTGRPSLEDALPNLDNWVNGLFPVPLHSFREEQSLFPPAFLFKLEDARLNAVKTEGGAARANLASWSYRYHPNAALAASMIAKGLLEASAIEAHPPFAWLRHPALPMVQALPMTQSLRPPAYPSASRQLVPFELPYKESGWAFQSAGVPAEGWPLVKAGTEAQAAPAWAGRSDLPLASLSLPGLQLLPGEGPGTAGSPFDTLKAAFRLDLPYNDEAHALAQLPKVPQDPGISNPLPDAPPPEPPKPLSRETFEEHWQQLSTLASLAAADGVEAFQDDGSGKAELKNLAEPLSWPASITIDDETYPGSLTLQNTADAANPELDDEKIALSGQRALKGISGRFSPQGGQKLRLNPAGSDVFEIEAHAMAARREGLAHDDSISSLRDQRGLRRAATADGSSVLSTLVELEQEGRTETYALTTLTQAQALPLSDGNNWRLWFKGLPLKQSNNTFIRHRSDENQDINDPEALSKTQNYLQAYEWRLSDGQVNSNGRLGLLGLHFYPLALEKVEIDSGQLKAVDISGRLQLPLMEAKEQEQLSNAVTLSFRQENGSFQLQSIAVEAGALVEWPLEVSAGPAGEVPRLCFSEVSLDNGTLTLPSPEARFLLFDSEWKIPLGSLQVAHDQSAEWAEADNSAAAGLNLSKVSLTLGLDTAGGVYQHLLGAQFDIRLGKRSPLSFSSKVAFALSGTAGTLQAAVVEHRLFGKLEAAGIQARYTRMALEFQWDKLVPGINTQVLPGWKLGDARQLSMPGFATLTFALSPGATAGIPALELKTAFIESLLLCRWGELITDNPLAASPEALFQSAAGDLSFGTTIQFDGKAWQEAFLVNGFLEVRNLISWPAALKLNAGADQLNGPGLAAAKAAGLPHLRHNMRVLFNQHELPAGLLKGLDSDILLFTFEAGKSWQFLAVAEHQLLDVASGRARVAVARWAGIQEVRLATPLRYRSFVEYLAGKPLTDAHLIGLDGGGEAAELPDPITIRGRVINQVGRGLPNVKVELWQDDPPVFTFFRKTTTDAGGHFTFTFSQGSIRSNIPGDADGFLQLSLFVGGSPGTQQLKQPWTVSKAGQDIILVIEQDVPPIHLFGEAFSEALAQALFKIEQDAILSEQFLVVEASTAQWLKRRAVADPGFANLQALPTGQQSAMVSSRKDYSISSPNDPEWQLLMVPFLGRLQAEESHAGNAMSADPVKQLESLSSEVPVLLQGFTSIAKGATSVAVVRFDLSPAGRWPRLDPNMLEESWFRMINLPDESQPSFLPSISAALPDNSSRLSRAAAISHAFRNKRQQYPPAMDTSPLPEYGRTGTILWREGSLIQFDFASDPEKEATSRQPWLLFAIQWQSLSGGGQPVAPVYPAATVLPASGQAGLPQALAASPYLSLRFLPAPAGDGQLIIEAVSAELLCLETSRGQLRPAAGRLAERAGFLGEGDAVDETAIENDMLNSLGLWAEEKHAILCPESPLAVLRLRKIYRNTANVEGEAPLVVRYAFRLAGLSQAPSFARRSFNLRAKARRLHFREGQFNGFRLPDNPQPFELAAPQLNGVQPVYFDKGIENAGFTEQLAQELPWGLSTLRLSTRLTEGGKTVIGPAPEEKPSVLWWQGLQHFVQFRAAQEGVASAGLPELFRAGAIRSLLPALPDIPMPAVKATEGEKWQSVLPSEMRLMPVGSRAGAYFVYRHQLIRQKWANGAYETLVSESIPVQHRFPRPVSLPANQPGLRAKALQPWASYFEPQAGLHATANPKDEAFFAGNADKPARRLQMELASPAGGAATKEWDGALEFNVLSESETGVLAKWAIVLEIAISGLTFTHDEKTWTDAGGVLKTSLPAIAGNDSLQQQWQQAISSLAPGATLKVKAYVQDKGVHGTAGFQQQLEFLLRMADNQLPRLPLLPYFVHFEDPEYNRELVSASGNASIQLMLSNEFYTLRLSADRRAYNPDSRLALRFDWLEPGNPKEAYRVELLFKRIGKESGKNEDVGAWVGELGSTGALASGTLQPQSLFSVSLAGLMANAGSPLASGETLQLQMTVKNKLPSHTGFANTAGIVVLNLDIVEEAVIPNTRSAYGLLRRQAEASGEGPVECRRFAWGPNASRIEMVDADDLLQEIVRRRAVFQWTDTLRPRQGRQAQYRIQKISPGGSTHFPEFG